MYATYETSGNLEDKKLHKLIDNLNPDLRVKANREFFVMDPEDAYELLEAIAIISDSKKKLKRVKGKARTQSTKKPRIDFYKCGLKNGDELVYTEDPSVRVTVKGAHKVLYRDELTSLSSIVQDIKNAGSIQGTAFFTFNGERLVDIARRTQWKDYD